MKIRARRFFWVALGLALLLYIFLPGYLRWEVINERFKEYREKNEELSEENLKLKKEIWALKNDPLYIEEITRKELGYAKEGEVIYEIEKRESEDSFQR